MASPFGDAQDIQYMRKALAQAQSALKYDEVPIGAVVVAPSGEIIARAYNKVEKKHTQSAHAEVLALAKAGKKLKNWRLEGCWLYVTLEPCAACMHLIMMSRAAGIVFGAPSPLFGFHLDNDRILRVYKKDTVHIIAGVCAQESADMLQQFFKKKRRSQGGIKRGSQ